MNYYLKLILAVSVVLILSSCSDENDPACFFDHPTCIYEPEEENQITSIDTSSGTTIRITNTSRSVSIHAVNIVNHCATEWSGNEGVGIGKGDSRTFQVDPDTSYDVRVLYKNGTCDYQYDVTGPARVSVYRTHFNCPAPCA